MANAPEPLESRWWLNASLTGPPRAVPLSVRLRILLGGFCNQFGSFFFGFGMIFVWVFGGSNALYNLAFFSGNLAITEGTITAIVETNVSINESRIYEYCYSYTVNGDSYQGADRDFGGLYDPGDTVPVEYPTKETGRSRIKGMSTGSFGLLIAGVFPIVGLAFVTIGIRKGLKGGRLLRDAQT